MKILDRYGQEQELAVLRRAAIPDFEEFDLWITRDINYPDDYYRVTDGCTGWTIGVGGFTPEDAEQEAILSLKEKKVTSSVFKNILFKVLIDMDIRKTYNCWATKPVR